MNSSSQKFWAIPAIVVILALIFTGVLYWKNTAMTGAPAGDISVVPSTAAPAGNPSVATTSLEGSAVMATTTAGWKTYTDSQYGFSIKYPADAQVAIEGAQSENDAEVIFTVPESNPFYSTSTFAVAMISPASQADCDDMQAAMTPVATSSAIINGIHFVKGDASEAATGQRISSTRYCTLKDTTAYELLPMIEYGHDYSTSDGFNPAINVNDDSILDQMLSSFQFTN